MVGLLICILILSFLILCMLGIIALISVKKLMYVEQIVTELQALNNIYYKNSHEPTSPVENKQEKLRDVEETPLAVQDSVFSIVDDILSGKINIDEVNNNES